VTVLDRAEFERRRNCSRCGQRLTYTQYQMGAKQAMTKVCPLYAGGQEERLHDFLEHEHEYPARTRRGVLTRGSKRVRREQLTE
jgi:hypothetical protein